MAMAMGACWLALMPYLPLALMPYLPLALMPYLPLALMPYLPLALLHSYSVHPSTLPWPANL